MAAGNGVVRGGELGVLEMNSLPNPSAGSHHQDPHSVIDVVHENNFPYNFPHKEIQNVLWIEKSPEHWAALKEWDRKESYLRSKVDDKEKQSTDLKKQIVNLVWFFIAFQGVVLTVVSQLKSGNKPLCGIVWVPALLSSVAGLVTIIGVYINFSKLREVEIYIHNEKNAQRAVAARATKLRANGRDFKFIEHAQEGPGRKHSSGILISISNICVILSLFCFTGLFILSYIVILCNYLAVDKWNQNLQ